jgi:hypothetical protein
LSPGAGDNSAHSAQTRPAETLPPHTVQPCLTTDQKVGGSTPSRRARRANGTLLCDTPLGQREQITRLHTTIRSTIAPMDRRTWIFVLIGSILTGTATVLLGFGLNPQGCSGLTWFGDISFCPPRIEVLWFELSETEVIVWSVIVGSTAGAFLGLLVGRLYRRRMPARGTRLGVGTAVIVVALAACTGAHPAPSSRPTPAPAPFARYFFAASKMVGVLEVSQSPPSICYSTQSSPARPISITPSRFASGPPPGVPVGTSYTPRRNDFCDRTVDPDLAAALIAQPSLYVIRWRPEAGASAVSSPLAQ